MSTLVLVVTYWICCRVHVCTWNVMSTQPPDVDLRELLHLDNNEDIPDIVAVGLVINLIGKLHAFSKLRNQ